MTAFSAEAVLDSLKDFQRATVEHVTDRFYRSPEPSRRFLVADETGLGKSLVARGVIARTIEQLQDDDSVERIDVIYVCSNADIAEQNLRRLDVTGQEHLPFSSRLTLLAKHSRRLAATTAAVGKPVNLVSFTPGTSFEQGWRTGKAEERALIHILLSDHLGLTGWDERASRFLLKSTMRSEDNFYWTIQRLRRELDDDIDKAIVRAFIRAAKQKGCTRRFEQLIDEFGRRRTVPDGIRTQADALIVELRGELARASVNTLTPDLVILDEFQRFRHLLDLEEGGEAAELAHHLFDYGNAKVLLLSATPYKPYTLAEEERGGDSHHRDFMKTLAFLAEGSPMDLDAIGGLLGDFRTAVVSGSEKTELTRQLRERLLVGMSRTERPQLGKDGMLRERNLPAQPVTVDDLIGFSALRTLAAELESQATVEYWKSTPYFVNFMDGYQLGAAARDALASQKGRDRLQSLFATTQRLDRQAIEKFTPVDFGNGRLRALAAETVEEGWWQLLWVPPSLPYLQPAGAYAQEWVPSMTKRLIFSSWAATPTAIASLLSYDAERRIAEGSRLEGNTPSARRRIATRLDYRLEGARPAAMSALTLFWPHPGLADMADPLQLARTSTTSLSAEEATAAVANKLAAQLPPSMVGSATEVAQWRAYFGWTGALPSGTADERAIARALAGGDGATPEGDASDDPTGLSGHVNAALEVVHGPNQPADPDRAELLATLANLSLHAPGNIALRAFDRILEQPHEVTERGLWTAAAVAASGLRTLFNRLETILLLDKLARPNEPYWQTVLRYCADGNLQAVMDEYVHHLRSAIATVVLDDATLLDFATKVRDAIALRPSRYEAFDPTEPEESLAFSSRFAVRYGGKRQDQESARQPLVRNAFNSPFWPFVLASTSVGQEGVDFHWWCHAVVHWNVPVNPVDFEQREGRVNRFGGHAVRRNIVEKHRDEVLQSRVRDPWKAAYDIADAASRGLGEFAPYWVYPGPHKVERHLLSYPLSRDQAKAIALKDDLALYRLTFGQPRQEDLVELLKRRGVQPPNRGGVIDLRPALSS